MRNSWPVTNGDDFSCWDMREMVEMRKSYPLLCQAILALIENSNLQTLHSRQVCLEKLESLTSQNHGSFIPRPTPCLLIHTSIGKEFPEYEPIDIVIDAALACTHSDGKSTG